MNIEESFVEKLQRQSREILQKLRELKTKIEKTTKFYKYFAFAV
jgi:hypothetical protein